MDRFIRHLDEASLEAIDALRASNIQTLMSPDCDATAGSAVITVGAVSIPLQSGRFFILENDWADTPKEWIDYFMLTARTASEPHTVTFVPESGSGTAAYRADHMMLRLGASMGIERIDVFCAEEDGTNESVSYDAGIRVVRQDGTSFAIVREMSITGFLQIAHTEQDVAELTAGLHVRRTL